MEGNISIYIYWNLDLEDEVHSIWDLWVSGLKNASAMSFFEIGQACNNFWSGLENYDFLDGRLPQPDCDTSKSS